MQKKILSFLGLMLIGIFLAMPVTVLAAVNLPVDVLLSKTLTPDTVNNGDYRKSVLHNGTIYVPDKSSTKVTAVNLLDKSVKWEFTTGRQNEYPALTSVNDLILLSTGSKIYAIKDNGSEAVLQWSKDYGGYGFTSDGTSLYFKKGAKIAAIDLVSGNEKWEYTLPARENASSPTVGGGKVFFATDNQMDMERKLYALDAATSQVLWTTSTEYFYQTPEYSDGKVYVTLHQDLVEYDAATGKFLSKLRIAPNFTFEMNDDTIFAKTAGDGILWAYNKQTKVLRWKVSFPSGAHVDRTPFSNGPLILSQQYVLLENGGVIKWFDVTNGALARTLEAGGSKIVPHAAEDNLLVTTDNASNMYVFSTNVAPADRDTVKPGLLIEGMTPDFSPYEGTKVGNLRFFLFEDSKVKVYVKNQDKKVVRTMDLGLLNKGMNEMAWEGKDNAGAIVPNGPYTFVFHLVDRSGNEAWLEDPARKMTVSGVSPNPAPPAVPTPDTNQNIVYTVQAGDTLWKIAQKYNVTTQAIMDANSLDPAKYLYVGQKLNIPGQQQPPSQPQTPMITHVVQAGDTLYKIAQKYIVTVQAIINANNLDPAKYLYIGQKLMIPAQQPAPEPVTPTTEHVVQSGDMLWKIALKYNVTTQSIVDANKLDPTKYLYVGQKLIIPAK